MVPSIHGLIVAGICVLMLVLKRPIREFFAGLLIAALFGSTEAIALPMLGGASLTVPYFFVFFFVVRLLLLAHRWPSLLLASINANIWLLLFAIYGVAAALILPRLFEGSMAVFSMRALPYRTLLTPSSQNITQAFYLVLTALTALASYVTARLPKGEEALVFGLTIASVIFVIFGVLDLVGFYVTGGDFLASLKTASYVIVSQSDMGVRRISGSFTEPSAFATFGAAPLLLLLYLWLVDFKGTRFGILGLAVAIMLALSTSSTAFVMLAVAILMIAIGGVMIPMSSRIRQRKFVILCSVIGACVVAGVALAVIMPSFVATFSEVFQNATIEKSKSGSAIERGIWAAQGIEALKVSKGLGIGPGSFRSSGLAQAVLGSMGFFGAICLVLYCFKIVSACFRRIPQVDRRLIVACCVAAILMLTPPLLVGPAPDPGILFGAIAGFALGLQRKATSMALAAAAEARTQSADQQQAQRRSPLPIT